MSRSEGLSDEALQLRRETWKHIRTIIASHRSMDERLALCINAATVYAAVTGDDSLMPPMVASERQKLIDEIPRAMKTAKSVVAEQAKNQGSMFEL